MEDVYFASLGVGGTESMTESEEGFVGWRVEEDVRLIDGVAFGSAPYLKVEGERLFLPVVVVFLGLSVLHLEGEGVVRGLRVHFAGDVEFVRQAAGEGDDVDGSSFDGVDGLDGVLSSEIFLDVCFVVSGRSGGGSGFVAGVGGGGFRDGEGGKGGGAHEIDAGTGRPHGFVARVGGGRVGDVGNVLNDERGKFGDGALLRLLLLFLLLRLCVGGRILVHFRTAISDRFAAAIALFLMVVRQSNANGKFSQSKRDGISHNLLSQEQSPRLDRRNRLSSQRNGQTGGRGSRRRQTHRQSGLFVRKRRRHGGRLRHDLIWLGMLIFIVAARFVSFAFAASVAATVIVAVIAVDVVVAIVGRLVGGHGHLGHDAGVIGQMAGGEVG